MLPTGTVTFLFTDIEGSTRLLHDLGEGYADLLAEHHRLLRSVWSSHSGIEIDTQGDAFFVVFERASDAVAAAGAAQAALEPTRLRVRIGLHTGEPMLTDTGYVGMDVHRAARIVAAGHGGQVLLSQTTHDLVAVPGLRDLGEHALRDLRQPERIWQLGETEFPPLKSLNPTNLPSQPTPLIGRARELPEVVGLVRSHSRVVTLTGPGGSGKTRLALEAATQVVGDYPSGVFWVSLAPLRDSALVFETVAQIVGAKNGLAEHFAGKRALLLLDNFEHVVEAAASLSELLAACAGLDSLVTSRELLRIKGEREFAVPPLLEADAVELFAARSGHEPDEATAELCRRLDNLPLPVELAAARTIVLSPAQILDRLAGRLDLLRGGRDAEARHATLRTTIEWSYELLDEHEQLLFASLAVFAGGCTLDAVEQVCGADLDTLASLLDKNLVRRTEGRYWMLETIRDFALERLTADGEEEALRERHAAYFHGLASENEPLLRRHGQTEAVAWFRAEHDNIRAALDFTRARGESRSHAELATACWYFWHLAGFLHEGRRRLRSALADSEGLTPSEVAPLHDGLAVLSVLLGDVPALRSHAETSFRLRDGSRDDPGLLRSRLNLALAAIFEGDNARGEALLEEMAAHARAVGDAWFLGIALADLAANAFDRADYARARSLDEEALALAEEVGDVQLRVGISATLAACEVELGEAERAEVRYRDTIAGCRDGDFPEQLIWSLNGLGILHAQRGDWARALRLLGAAEGVGAEIEYANVLEKGRHDRGVALVAEHVGEAAVAAGLANGRAMGRDAAIAYALAGPVPA